MEQSNSRGLITPLIILDKDGTLIAFESMWHTWFRRFLRHLLDQGCLSLQARMGLAGTLGFDPVDLDDWDPDGPLTLASTGEVLLLAASQLYACQGMSWEQALSRVQAAEVHARATLDDPELLTTVGDVAATLQLLRDGGHVLALATTDTRASTTRHLEILGLASYFSAVVCGDDGIPLKPAPDMALEICRRLGFAPEQAVMVGDSSFDMLMAHRAGLARAIGVSSGSMPAERLAPFADLVIADIHRLVDVDGGSE
mgnify:CR=1 FL=1